MATQQKPQQVALVRSPEIAEQFLLTEKAKARITPFLPKGVEIDRVVASARQAVADNPKLLDCTVASLVRSVAKIQQWGLEIGDTAHLVPFGKTVTPIADYKGLAQLIRASNAVRSVELRVVYANEHCEVKYGTSAEIVHIPMHRKSERGPIVGAYVVFGLPFGRSTFEYMGADDIEEIRQKHSKQWKDGSLPAWYAKKTVLRQGVKILPKDPKLAEALKVVHDEEATEQGDDTDEMPRVYSLSPAKEESSPSPEIHPSAPAASDDDEFIDDRDLDD